MFPIGYLSEVPPGETISWQNFITGHHVRDKTLPREGGEGGGGLSCVLCLSLSQCPRSFTNSLRNYVNTASSSSSSSFSFLPPSARLLFGLYRCPEAFWIAKFLPFHHALSTYQVRNICFVRVRIIFSSSNMVTSYIYRILSFISELKFAGGNFFLKISRHKKFLYIWDHMDCSA